jgi:hypothetical protein
MVALGQTEQPYAPYSNICPISGWTGANVSRTGFNQWDEETESGGYWSNGAERVDDNQIRSKNYIHVIPNTTYATNGQIGFIKYFDCNKNFISIEAENGITCQFTTPDNCAFIKFSSAVARLPICLNISDLAKNGTYEAYTGNNTYSITFPQAAGTVYGGELTVNKDGSGSLVVDRYNVTNIEDFTMGLYTSGNRRRFEFINTTNNIPNIKGTSACITSHFEVLTTGANVPFGNMIISAGSQDYYTFFDRDERFADVAAFKSWLQEEENKGTPVQIVIELATPVTYSLTPGQVKTLLGVNNIWADTGDIISVTYPADTKMYIDNKITQAIAAALNA